MSNLKPSKESVRPPKRNRVPNVRYFNEEYKTSAKIQKLANLVGSKDILDKNKDNLTPVVNSSVNDKKEKEKILPNGFVGFMPVRMTNRLLEYVPIIPVQVWTIFSLYTILKKHRVLPS
jgi:hypothetical protein